ncbi:MAG: SBBP repeat-containing protein, partial [Planctomycetota bacterium]|nr:SBBP repeat-containing protein [Planctomycetota bacterium]
SAVGLEPLAARSNYLRGNDQSKWQTDVPHYGRVRYQDVYPGIDIEYYGSSGAMEFDFLVRPGADPGRIRMEFEGAAGIEIDDDGDLILRKGEHELRHRKPLIYQTVSGQRAEIEGRYNLEKDGTVTFRLSDYDAGLTVVIDPLIEWQETIGGSGDDEFSAVAIGPDGTIHVAGRTESTDIPVMNGLQSVNQGGPSDAYIAIFRPDGTLISATFLGGSGRDEANDIVVDRNGVVYVIGTTNSPNFPITEGAFQRSFGGGDADAFVTIFSPSFPNGSDLVGSTYLGGPGLELGTGIALDNQRSGFFVTGATFGNGFPVTQGAFQTDFMGEADAFVSKFNSAGTELIASTLFGGAGLDIPVDIDVDADGNPYITGATDSPDVPITDNAFQPLPGGGVDVFVAKFPGDLDDLDFGTYLGGPGDDRPEGADLDSFGGVWIGGSTTGGLPTTPNAPNPDYLGGPTDGFLARIAVTDRSQSVPPGGFLARIVVPDRNQSVPPGGLGLLNGEPLVTYTGDENRNSVLDVQVVSDHGRGLVITSESYFSADPARVKGCGDDPLLGPTTKIIIFNLTTGMLIDTPDGNCIFDGQILDLETDPFFNFGKVFGSGFVFTDTGSDATVIQIDTDSVFESAAGADLELTKRLIGVVGGGINLNTMLAFDVIVRNKGPDPATNVRVTDTLPRGFVYESGAAAGCTQADRELMCDVGTIPPGEREMIKVLARTGTATGRFINIARATADNLIGPERIAQSSIQVSHRVDLRLTKTLVRSDSNELEYRYEVENKSEDREAMDLRLDDVLPPELLDPQFESSRGDCRLNLASPLVRTANSTLNCTLEALPAGEKWVVTLRGRPKDLRATISNRAIVRAGETQAIATSEATFVKEDGAAAADVGLLLIMRPSDEGGMCAGLDAAVSNQGLDAAAGVQVDISQITSANVTKIDPDCSGSGRSINCSIGKLNPDEFRLLKFTVCAANSAANARFRGLATAETPDPDPTNNAASTGAELDDLGSVRIFGINSSSGFHRREVVSPGSDPSLFGEGLAGETIVADRVPLLLELGGVSVELNGIPAPLIFVSPNQINFQTPWELQADAKATVVVRNNGGESLPAKVFIVPFNPGIFTTTQTGSGQAAVLVAGTVAIAAPEASIPGAVTRPVKIGEFISIFATGLGAVDNQPPTGAASPASPLARTKTNPVVTIGGVEAGLTFSGLAPGFVGLYQVNAQVAAGTPVGDAVDLLLSSGLVPSNAVTIAVAPR